MRVEVLQQDIAEAVRLSRRYPSQRTPSLECPLACALERITGAVWVVGPIKAYPAGGVRNAAALPLVAIQAVQTWDRWDHRDKKRGVPCPLVPLSFELAIEGTLTQPPPATE